MGSTPGYPDSLQEEQREAEGRQKWELAAGGLETALGECLGSLSPTGPWRAPRAGAVPEGIAASQARAAEGSGGSWQGSSEAAPPGGLRAPSRDQAGSLPPQKLFPPGCAQPRSSSLLPWGSARVNHPGDASRPASLLAQPELHPQRGARPRHTSRNGPALLLQPR